METEGKYGLFVSVYKTLTTSINGLDLELGNRYLRAGGDLLLADLHLGKTMHFRKAGLPIPARARGGDQSALLQLLNGQKPDRLIVLGDLFHSEYNSEVEELTMVTSHFSETEFILVKGNHDIMADSDYRSMDFLTCRSMEWKGFVLTHEPLEDVPPGSVNIHGHLHPGIKLSGKGRQSMTVPCFHLGKQRLSLPAFGALTGLMKVKLKKSDVVFGIIDNEVHRLI